MGHTGTGPVGSSNGPQGHPNIAPNNWVPDPRDPRHTVLPPRPKDDRSVTVQVETVVDEQTGDVRLVNVAAKKLPKEVEYAISILQTELDHLDDWRRFLQGKIDELRRNHAK